MKWIRSATLFLAGIAVGALWTQSIAAQNRATGHRINHVGISVTNFDESLKFYTQVMGFKEAYHAFVEGGWSIKAMHRTIMLSSVYQMSSQVPQPVHDADPAGQIDALL